MVVSAGALLGWAVRRIAFSRATEIGDSSVGASGPLVVPGLSPALPSGPPAADSELGDALRRWHANWHAGEGEWCSEAERVLHEEFGALAVSDLQLLHDTLAHDHRELRERAFEEVWRQGAFMTEHVEGGTQQSTLRPPRGAITRRRYLPAPDGMYERQEAWLLRGEFPRVYELRDQIVLLSWMAQDSGLVLETAQMSNTLPLEVGVGIRTTPDGVKGK